MHKWAYLLIAAGAAMWGIIGIFVQALYSFGFSPGQVVAIRAISAASILLIYTATVNRHSLKIRPLDLKYFIGTGIFSIVFFNWCYFTVIKEASLSVAAILLYTAPAFVTVISRFVFKEWLTFRKIAALIATILGCALVVGFLPSMQVSVSTLGIVVGLGSGLGYALYSIFGKLASSKYSSLTITTYTFIIAGTFMLPVSRIWEATDLFAQAEVWIYALGLGLIPTVLAYTLYTLGLSQIESSRASITATIEPIVAAMVGTALFGDILTGWQVLGIVLVLSAVFLVQEVSRTKHPELNRDGTCGQ